MKKILTTILAVATMVTTFGMAVCAAPSPSNIGIVTGTVDATDAKGNYVAIEVVPTDVEIPEIDTLKAADMTDSDRAVLNSDDCAVIGIVDLQKVGDGEVTFPIDVTVKIPSVTSSTKLAVFHNVGGDGVTWQSETSKCGDGTVTIYGLTSLSPFVFIADNTTLASSASVAATESPKTGEMPIVPIAKAIAFGAGVLVVVLLMKQRPVRTK